MTDKEIELLFKSIDNFETFLKNVEQRQNITLNNDIKLKFNVGLTDSVDLYLADKKLTLDNFMFRKIINELAIEKVRHDNQELSRKNKISDERIRNEIFDLGENKYKVHKEYIENMYFASDIASVHGAYLRKLEDLMRVFNRDNILIVDEKEAETKEDLINILKSYGFKHIEQDLKLKRG